jgi:hypothetical protein
MADIKLFVRSKFYKVTRQLLKYCLEVCGEGKKTGEVEKVSVVLFPDLHFCRNRSAAHCCQPPQSDLFFLNVQGC